MEAAQSSSEIQDSESNVSSDVLCTANECDSDGNNCEQLWLNLGCKDLGYRFGIHYSTVSRYFCKWLDILYNRLSVFVSWPERDQLLKTMPLEFQKNFRKCAIIIDCFKIFIERPTSLTARAQTWSGRS